MLYVCDTGRDATSEVEQVCDEGRHLVDPSASDYLEIIANTSAVIETREFLDLVIPENEISNVCQVRDSNKTLSETRQSFASRYPQLVHHLLPNPPCFTAPAACTGCLLLGQQLLLNLKSQLSGKFLLVLSGFRDSPVLLRHPWETETCLPRKRERHRRYIDCMAILLWISWLLANTLAKNAH